MRIGLVLGGGGVRGASWMMGALHGLALETGWDPAAADVVVGASAGAVVAALTLAGARPWEALAPDGGGLLRELLDAAAFHPEPTLRSLWPGSPALVRRALRRGPAHLVQALAGALPEGCVSTEPIARLVRDRAPRGWPAGGRLWIAATDFATGERVAFGRDGAPAVELATAVAASCAIPGFYRPVPVGGRRYVDGGLVAGANLDLVAGEGLDVVVCLNPLSSRPGAPAGVTGPVRALLHRRLLARARPAERAGARLVLLEPDGPSIRLIGLNPMSRRAVGEVGVAAAAEVRRSTRDPLVRANLAALTR